MILYQIPVCRNQRESNRFCFSSSKAEPIKENSKETFILNHTLWRSSVFVCIALIWLGQYLFIDKHGIGGPKPHGIGGPKPVCLSPCLSVEHVHVKEPLISLWRHPTCLLMFKRGFSNCVGVQSVLIIRRTSPILLRSARTNSKIKFYVFFAPCTVIYLWNINQQSAQLSKWIFNF
jgi:hypothetical protein